MKADGWGPAAGGPVRMLPASPSLAPPMRVPHTPASILESVSTPLQPAHLAMCVYFSSKLVISSKFHAPVSPDPRGVRGLQSGRHQSLMQA